MKNHRETMQFLVTNIIQEAKMPEIPNYIFHNYEPITLRTLAEHFHFTDSY